ncbi:MAG: response regulator [Chloroflexota bacterium]|nr:response regulator [Chloroflexota bacterium]
MKVRFWGTRGSLPSPGPSTCRFGGNTSCVEVTAGETLIVLDSGTGVRNLGKALLRERGKPVIGHVLLSHTHWDHIQGFPFFPPLLVPGNHFTFYSARGYDRSLRDIFNAQMAYPYFPLKLAQMQSTAVFREIGEESFDLGDIRVTSRFLNHTTLTLGYRLTHADACVVYATDTEPFGTYHAGSQRAFLHEGDRRFISFVEGADVLIHDAQYTQAEYAAKIGWGHSPVEYAVEVALAAGVRRLVLFHHDIDRTDAEVEGLEALARRIVAERGARLEVTAAAEASEIDVAGPAESNGSDGARRRHRLLIADDDPDMVAVMKEAFADAESYDVEVAADGEELIAKAVQFRPDVVVSDLVMPKLDAYEATERLRSMDSLRSVPVIVVTGRADEQQEARGFELGVTDFVRKPFALAQLTARVQMWLERQAGPVDLAAGPTVREDVAGESDDASVQASSLSGAAGTAAGRLQASSE